MFKCRTRFFLILMVSLSHSNIPKNWFRRISEISRVMLLGEDVWRMAHFEDFATLNLQLNQEAMGLHSHSFCHPTSLTCCDKQVCRCCTMRIADEVRDQLYHKGNGWEVLQLWFLLFLLAIQRQCPVSITLLVLLKECLGYMIPSDVLLHDRLFIPNIGIFPVSCFR